MFIIQSLTSALFLQFPAIGGRKLIFVAGTNNGNNIYIRGNAGADAIGVTIYTSVLIRPLLQYPIGIVVTPTRVYWGGYETNPPGTIINWPTGLTAIGVNAPPGWLACDGSIYPTSTYDLLFAAIGYTYGGSGGGFNVPDLRGRATAGADTMQTAVGSAGRLNNWAPGTAGGEATHVLTPNEIPLGPSGSAGSNGVLVGNSTPAAGHNNIQPTMTVTKLIRY